MPPKICTFDSLSAENAKPYDALCPGACVMSNLPLYFFAIVVASNFPDASWYSAMFVFKSSCCCIAAVNLCAGMNLVSLSFLVFSFFFFLVSLFFIMGIGKGSDSVVGTDAAARLENMPPPIFVDVILNVWG